MHPERWKRVEALCESALSLDPTRRGDFLRAECGSDDLLRQEVESLLVSGDRAVDFMQIPELPKQPQVGQRVSRYEIQEKLGEGGMGVVYKARDARLDRYVAVKVLPAERVADPERKRCFVREAKSASALSHPNIVTVHDIDHADGVDFIAMEYVKGKTLAELIGRKGLEVRQALNYAIPLADALATVHAAGIVHRDLKPGNVMVTGDGRVKVLDFGLAKLTETAPGPLEERQMAQPSTGMGGVVGTLNYMSPEQAEGKKVDARSDVFSFGSLLYEMLTGRHPFRQDTPTQTIAALLRMDPQPLGPGIPRDLEMLVMRCLRKDPARRFQYMADVKIVLQDLIEEMDSGAIDADAAPKRKRPWLPWVTGAAVLLLSAAGLAWWLSVGAPPRDLRPVALTSTGRACYPSFSPDGTKVVFAWTGEQDEKPQIYVKQPGVFGPPARLTEDPLGATMPVWSPDDRWIAYRRLRAGGADLVVIPPLGGPERTLADLSGTEGGLSWTPDGKWLAFAQNDSPITSSLWAIAIETGERRRLTAFQTKAAGGHGALGDSWPAFSPDGRSLAFARQVNFYVYELCVQPLTEDMRPDGAPRLVTDRRRAILAGLTWTTDGKELVYSDGMAPSLWRVAASGGRDPRQLTYTVAAGWPTIAGRLPRLAYARSITNVNLWRLDIRTGERRPLVASSVYEFSQYPQYSPDGRRLAFQSRRSGDMEVWACDATGGNCLQLTSFKGPVGGVPRWSPDSRWIAMDSRVSGSPEIYVMPADGGSPRRLTDNPSNDMAPSWSHDGRWIYFASDRSGRYEVWKARSGGGQAVQVTRAGGFAAFEAPDGQYLYYTKFDLQGQRKALFKMPAGGGQEVQVVPGINHWADFGLTSKGLYFAPYDEDSIQFLDSASGKVRSLAALDKSVDYGLTVSPDNAYVLWSQVDRVTQNLMLVEGFR